VSDVASAELVITLTPGEQRRGLWCDTCSLPSRVEQDFYSITKRGVSTLTSASVQNTGATMPKTVDRLDVLAEIDQDLRAAILDRDRAYRKKRVKDTPANRDAYEAACADVDELLDMRHEIAAGAGQGS
jgi:hypothetical protein